MAVTAALSGCGVGPAERPTPRVEVQVAASDGTPVDGFSVQFDERAGRVTSSEVEVVGDSTFHVLQDASATVVVVARKAGFHDALAVLDPPPTPEQGVRRVDLLLVPEGDCLSIAPACADAGGDGPEFVPGEVFFEASNWLWPDEVATALAPYCLDTDPNPFGKRFYVGRRLRRRPGRGHRAARRERPGFRGVPARLRGNPARRRRDRARVVSRHGDDQRGTRSHRLHRGCDGWRPCCRRPTASSPWSPEASGRGPARSSATPPSSPPAPTFFSRNRRSSRRLANTATLHRPFSFSISPANAARGSTSFPRLPGSGSCPYRNPDYTAPQAGPRRVYRTPVCSPAAREGDSRCRPSD